VKGRKSPSWRGMKNAQMMLSES